MGELTTRGLVATATFLLHDGHDQMRRIAKQPGADGLNWRPGPGTNSIAALIAHAMDAERYLLAALADVEITRDREAQFEFRVSDAGTLLRLIDALEHEVDEYLARVDNSRLTSLVTRPRHQHEGIWWLLHSIEHSREHLGQAELTLQLLEQRQGEAQ